MSKKVLFMSFGRLGKSLVESKILPIIELGIFDEIFAFCEDEGFALPKVTYVTKSNYWIQRVFKHRIIDRICELIQLIQYAAKIKPVSINGYQLVPKGINTFLASKFTKTHSIISSIGGVPEIKTYLKPQRLWEFINIFVLKYSDLVTTKGKAVTDYLVKKGVDQDKIFTFNGAIDINRFRLDEAVGKDIDALFVGNFSELKGPDRFVRIIHKLSRDMPNVKAAMLGSGELYDDTLKLIKKLGLGDNIKLEGFRADTDIYFKRSKILIMPSESEGLATAMIEAMACGCIPIVSDVGCQSEAAKHGVNAYLVERFDDIDVYVRLAKDLLNNENLREHISLESVKFSALNYSPKAQARVLKMIFMSDKRLKTLFD